MDTEQPEDWDTGEMSGRVSIGSHKLWLSVHGPDRKPGDPLVIIIPGLANSTSGWAAVRRGLTAFARVLQYERSGYGESDVSTEKPTASSIAKELSLLLRNANLLPPYVVVAHSWGGILSREFLALHPKDIIGMIFIEANQERTLDVLDWRQLALSDLLIGVNSSDVTGISQNHKLTDEEWRIYEDTKGTEKHQRQAALEFAEYPNSFSVLKSKSQLHRASPFLGDHPVYVIRGNNKADFEKLLKAGLARGNGGGAKQAEFEEILGTWDEKDQTLQSEILLLSSRSRYIKTEKSGHNIHLTEPELIVESVSWVLSHSNKNVK
ncbi:Alpha/Beta hydrolase protein [Talaromyces proteolyticus]|uniref:Alpha/Beta hydrolase protein n=1 Tax=Talaromyces proteolyticus TaxID=1131652 RepID=A0AAD4PW20_9EURO|nr:Alpha/Beta hydrolase protein [Talaromyces proteolyticus]KAH8691417.1 Alpha/Beta hydrolase protein [Talaromyces proteolyticus]